jgi:hypothetical protein
MKYTTDLVEVDVPEGCSIVLVLSKDSDENLDLTASAALLLDEVIKSDTDLMESIDNAVRSGESFIGNKSDIVKTESTEVDDTVQIGEISFPTEIAVYVKGVQLEHSLAGVSLAKSLENAIDFMREVQP